MNNSKKFLIYGSLAVLVLIITVTVLFFKLSSSKNIIIKEAEEGDISIFHGVPSDAIMIFDFKRLDHFAPMLNDTSSFAALLFDEQNPLVKLQQQFLAFKEIGKLPFVYSLHYSSKNTVSFLQVMDVSQYEGAGEMFNKIKEESEPAKRRYNNSDIYSYRNGLHIAIHKNLFLASNSSYVLESAIRHLENGTSILDNREFKNLIVKNGLKECVYINHKQIGKFFSGEIERRFLSYSDFFLQLSSWSVLEFIQSPGVLRLKGYFANNREESNFSSMFSRQVNKKSRMGEILPANTIFAFSLPITQVKSYVSSLKLFLEIQKKLSKYLYVQQVIKLESGPAPVEWMESLNIEEVVSGYCKFGEKCEWITFIREKSDFGINDVLSTVVDKRKKPVAETFKHKGYVSSVLGGLFAECNEESFCKIDNWMVIGPKKMIEEFCNGNANYYSLDNYISQTPASSFLNSEATTKIGINLKEAGDTVLQVFKPYMRALLERSLKKNNFEYATLGIIPTDSGNVELDISLYATRLKELPKPRIRESGSGVVKFEVDSNIILPAGPYRLKKLNAYLGQLPNMRLSYMDTSQRGLWAIPFETPLCGFVGEVDFFKNEKIQMAFVSGDKFYLLDKLARFVRGYPVKLPKRVVYGPKVMDLKGDKNYTIMVLNEDNTISWYTLDGKHVEGWKDIKVPEFVKELPQLTRIGKNTYWVLKAPSQLRIYTMSGKEIVITDKNNKKKIDRESVIKFVSGDDILVKGIDGKDFILNLVTGKTKKVK